MGWFWVGGRGGGGGREGEDRTTLFYLGDAGRGGELVEFGALY